MFTVSGCLVADPPLQDAPRRTPPMLDLARALPLITDIIVWESNAGQGGPTPDVEFSVPVRSEDVGEELWYALHVDYSFNGQIVPPGNRTLAASVFDDTERALEVTLPVEDSAPDGCSQITLVVAHKSSWDEGNARPRYVEGLGDTGMATWWLNKNPDPEDPNTLRGCPNRAEVTP